MNGMAGLGLHYQYAFQKSGTNNSVDRLMDFYNEGRKYEYVITVFNRGEKEECPIFPGLFTRLSWSDFRDPDDFTGIDEEKLEMARK